MEINFHYGYVDLAAEILVKSLEAMGFHNLLLGIGFQKINFKMCVKKCGPYYKRKKTKQKNTQ